MNTNHNFKLLNAATLYGGQVLTTSPISEQINAPDMAGITAKHSALNTAGTGVLSADFRADIDLLSMYWHDRDGNNGEKIEVTESGNYAVKSSTGGVLYLTVNIDELQGGIDSHNIEIAHTINSFFPKIKSINILNGYTDYITFYLLNNNPVIKENVIFYIKNQSNTDSYITIGAGEIGDGINTGVAVTSPDAVTPPTGVTFSAAAEYSPIIIGDMPAHSVCPLYFKRTISAGQRVQKMADFAFEIDAFEKEI